jgi:glutamate synthase (ferredoxin)
VKAVYPRGAYETIAAMVEKKLINSSLEKAIDQYIHAVDHGILKIMSKMGISCADGYIRAQIFEAVGLSREVVDTYFTGTVSRVDGLTLSEIEAECVAKHNRACMALIRTFLRAADSNGSVTARSISTIRSPFICSSKPSGPTIMTSTSNIER